MEGVAAIAGLATVLVIITLTALRTKRKEGAATQVATTATEKANALVRFFKGKKAAADLSDDDKLRNLRDDAGDR